MICSRAGNILTLEAIGSIRCSPEMPLWWVLRRCRGRARRVVPAGRGWSGTARGGAGTARVEDLGEAATARGKWRGGRGGDGDREVATRGRRRRPEGGSDEGEVAEEKASPKFGGGDGVPGLWRMRSRLPLRMIFGEKTGTVAVQGGLGPPLQMV